MSRIVTRLFIITCTSLLFMLSTCVAEDTIRAELEGYLTQGDTKAAEKMLTKRLKETPQDAQGQYGLGIVRVLQAVENLGDNLYRYGLQPESGRLPFVRLPVPENPNPEKITYEKWRKVLEQFVKDLDEAAQTLAKVQAEDVKLKLPVGMIRLDLNRDGQATESETFWNVFTRVAWRAAKLNEEQKRFEIGFDRADVHWMIGYTHLIRAMAEAWLAHDTQQFFEMTAPIFFSSLESPYGILGREERTAGFDEDAIADLIVAIHLMRLEPTEPERMRKAREHLLAMIGQSRKCWEHAIQEMDDDREWIPNANQTSLTPLDVTEERIEGWRLFLDEAEAVLNGQRLLPHWRVKANKGINLWKVFERPRTFDLVMWVHGAAAIPYLEQGELVSKETANTLNRIFQGRFVAFAVWFQ